MTDTNPFAHDLLPDEKIRELVARYQAGDREAAETVLAHNERLVLRVALHYYHASVTGDADMDDLLQLGRMGLLRAMDKFDAARPEKFVTYAFWWVRQSIKRYGIRGGMTVTMSYNATERRGKVARAVARHAQEHGALPSREQLSDATGESEERLSQLRAVTISLDAPEQESDVVALERMVDPSVDVETDAQERADSETIRALIARLPANWQTVIIRRYGLDGRPAASQRDVSRLLGVSGERVRQIEQAALTKLREFAENG